LAGAGAGRQEVLMFGWTARLLAAMAITLVAAGSVKGQPQDRQMGGIGITVFDDISIAVRTRPS
jgi:hypothetical protein